MNWTTNPRSVVAATEGATAVRTVVALARVGVATVTAECACPQSGAVAFHLGIEDGIICEIGPHGHNSPGRTPATGERNYDRGHTGDGDEDNYQYFHT
jgi:hypothetical protein